LDVKSVLTAQQAQQQETNFNQESKGRHLDYIEEQTEYLARWLKMI
jgi:hypothetical protein